MRTITIHWRQWRTMALNFKPAENFNNIMKNRYGLVRDRVLHTDGKIEYEVVDEQKYLLYILEWL